MALHRKKLGAKGAKLSATAAPSTQYSESSERK
jgi:hypothetical protein